MDVLDALDAPAVRAWSTLIVRQLDEHRGEINALNVFPVPDSDTGNNLLTTFRAADAAVAAVPDGDAARLLAVMASGAAGSAVGNSGFIASQVLRGFADAAAGASRCDGTVLLAGLRAGSDLGRDAVVEPVEGTILTVARAAAEAASAAAEAASPAAGEADGADDAGVPSLVRLARVAFAAAQRALDRTTAQLPELARAGVVDAGGRGLVIVLRALVEIVTGEAADLAAVHAPDRSAAEHVPHAGYDFEVQYLLDAPAAAVDALRGALDSLGDSVAVVPTGDGSWNVHAHVDDVGAAIEAGLDAGRPHAISVIRFADRDRDTGRDAALHAAAHVASPVASSIATGPPTGDVAVVAIAPGHGLAHLFEREGVVVVEGSAADLPTVAEVLSAIDGTGAAEIVLLPNASRVTGVAESAAVQARTTGDRRVTVVPTRSPVQGLSAVAVHDPHRRFDDDVVAMAEAAAATRYAEILITRDQALTAVGICEPGDVLGLIDGEVVEIGRGIVAVAFSIADRLLGVGVELMTVVVGDGAPSRIGASLETHVRSRSPLTDVAVFEGGQPDHPVIIGAE